MKIKCYGCGHSIEIDDSMESVECPKCGTLHKFVEPDVLLLGYDHSETTEDYSEVWEKVQEAQDNVEHLDDEALVEEVIHIVDFGLSPPKELLQIIQIYDGRKKLTKLQRRSLEGFYILSYCDKGFKA